MIASYQFSLPLIAIHYETLHFDQLSFDMTLSIILLWTQKSGPSSFANILIRQFSNRMWSKIPDFNLPIRRT